MVKYLEERRLEDQRKVSHLLEIPIVAGREWYPESPSDRMDAYDLCRAINNVAGHIGVTSEEVIGALSSLKNGMVQVGIIGELDTRTPEELQEEVDRVMDKAIELRIRKPQSKEK